MNDPNGLIYYKGKYHLFFQYSPDSDLWKDISWGHATSSNLLDWEEHAIAILADESGFIFSGSAVVDYKNITGFGSLENPAMVAMYTSVTNDIQSQALAFSLDEGMTWRKYEGNPVLDLGLKDFRDPNVAWFEEFNAWIMVLALADVHKIAFYSSPDLKSWKKLSEFGPMAAIGGVWECPDLFPLLTPEGLRKWVLIVSLNPGGPLGGSGTQYFIGDFDGTSFIVDDPERTTPLWIDYGKDFYAAVTFNDSPSERTLIGWCSNWEYANSVPALPYRGEMAIPRNLSLASDGKIHSTPAIDVGSAAVTVELADIFITPGGVTISQRDGELLVDRSKSTIDPGVFAAPLPAHLHGRNISLTIIEDIHSIEIFVEGGELVLTFLNY